MPRRLIKTLIQGDSGAGLESLLADLYEDLGLVLEVVSEAFRADVVISVVDPGGTPSDVWRLRQQTAAPVIGVLPVDDARVARRALSAGAAAVFSLDVPVERVKEVVRTVLRDHAPGAHRVQTSFGLGPRALKVIADLRRFERASGPEYKVRADAEHRLTSAIRADFGSRLPTPFRLGLHGRMEATIMRLDPLAIERLERAIQADRDELSRGP